MPHLIEHHPEHARFETLVNGHLCVADYTMSQGVMHLNHTGVHASG